MKSERVYLQVTVFFFLSDGARWLYRQLMTGFFFILTSLVRVMKVCRVGSPTIAAVAARSYQLSRMLLVPVDALAQSLQRRGVRTLRRQLDAIEARSGKQVLGSGSWVLAQRVAPDPKPKTQASSRFWVLGLGYWLRGSLRTQNPKPKTQYPR